MDTQEDETTLVKRASDARERRKLQNRLAQRNFREYIWHPINPYQPLRNNPGVPSRRQALKEKQQELQQQRDVVTEPISTYHQPTGHNVDRLSPLLPDATPQEAAPPDNVRTTNQVNSNASATEYPADTPLLASPEVHPPPLTCPAPSLSADPISPVSFPLFCSPDDLWIDRPGDQPRASGPEPYPPIFAGEMSTMTSPTTPHGAEPFTKQYSVETMKALASPHHRRSSVSKNPHRPLGHGEPYPNSLPRRLSSPTHPHYQHLSTPPDSSMSSCDSLPQRSAEGKMTLHICAEKGYANVLRFLLNYGAEIDATDSLGRTALHYAVINGHGDSVCVLLERGADTEVADEFGFNPLHIAAQLGHEAVVRMLVCEGADLNARIGDRGLSPS